MKHLVLSFTVSILFCGVSHGQIVISEIMQNPEDVVDQDGEWFEVYNTTASPIDLQGWDILDNGSESHTIASSVVVPAHGFAVLCIESSPIHNGINGGFTCDYQYSGIILFNSGDAIILRDASDTEVDRVEYDGGSSWPAPFGASIVFVGSASDDNNDPGNWIAATLRESTYGAAIINCCDKGSPQTQGSLATLPVELLRFDAVVSHRSVLLSWETESETNNAGFWIEHRQDGGFQQIAFIEGGGTTRTRRPYKYLVAELEAGPHVFRLKQVDLDGSVSYSPQVEVSLEPTGSFELSAAFPNPFNSSSTFSLVTRYSEHVLVDVVDVLGRTVAVLHDGQMTAGERRTFTLEANDLPSGTYIYRVAGGGFTGYRTALLLK